MGGLNENVICWLGHKKKSLENYQFPTSIAEIILSRFHLLDSYTQDILKLASVVGLEFTAQQLHDYMQKKKSSKKTMDDTLLALLQAQENLFVKDKKSKDKRSQIWYWKHQSILFAIQSLLPLK